MCALGWQHLARIVERNRKRRVRNDPNSLPQISIFWYAQYSKFSKISQTVGKGREFWDWELGARDFDFGFNLVMLVNLVNLAACFFSTKLAHFWD